MPSIYQIYKQSCERLKDKKREEINVRILLCAINNYQSMSDFYLKKDENIQDLPRFNEYFDRFLKGEPIQYIIGNTQFFGSNFKVDRRVLIPRQETEEVALYALRRIMSIFPDENIDLADVCCGSGCIGISLAKHLKLKNLYLSDVSSEACDVAVENLAFNNVNGYVLHGDGLKPFIKHNISIDVIVANPPYILNKDEVDVSVLNYEPHNALFVDENLTIYRSIINDAIKIMKDKMLIIFEIGYDLKEKLIKLLHENEYDVDITYTFRKDINGKDRIFSILLEKK